MTSHVFQAPTGAAPQKRFRHRRREFRRLQREALAFAIDVTPPFVYNLWHTHLDWSGFGNRSTRDRRKYWSALALMFQRTLDAAPHYPAPFQTWLLISEQDAGADALYFHTEGARSGFPLDLSSLRFVDAKQFPPLLAFSPSGGRYGALRVGVSGDVGERTFLVYCDGIGVPLDHQQLFGR